MAGIELWKIKVNLMGKHWNALSLMHYFYIKLASFWICKKLIIYTYLYAHIYRERADNVYVHMHTHIYKIKEVTQTILGFLSKWSECLVISLWTLSHQEKIFIFFFLMRFLNTVMPFTLSILELHHLKCVMLW